MKILHVLDHSIPLQSGYTFRTRAILRQQAAAKWLEQLESGRLTIHVDADDVAEPLEEVEANIDRNVRRLALSLLLVGLLISLAIASNSPLLSFLPDDLARLLLIPLALGAILSLIYVAKLVWEAWRSR